MSRDIDEDLIEATIRKVAEAKAAQKAPPEQDAAEEADEEPAAEPVRVVSSEAAADEPGVNEDLIEETIRRVTAQKAALRAASEADTTEPAEADADPVEEAVAFADSYDEDEPEDLQQPVALPAPAEPEDDSAWAATAARIERGLQETKTMLRTLIARVDELAPLVKQAAAPAPPWQPQQDEGWDESPQPPRAPVGLPPRPAILRDPSPLTATAEHLVTEERLSAAEREPLIDTRPLPKPLPPIHADARRGMDLLPRTYRITVEDKRRGVDLVPLHRALLGMEGVRDMSLLSYNNGVAIVSLETTDDIDPPSLEQAVSRAMARPARVETHNEFTMVVKLEE
ncbi:MAG: hypothetical protein WEC75_06995 [Dehalococcoidia bacterium]